MREPKARLRAHLLGAKAANITICKLNSPAFKSVGSRNGESTSGGPPVAGNNRSKRALMGCVGRCIQRGRASLQYSNGCPRCYVPPSLHSQTLRAVGSRIGESTSGGLPVAGNNRSKRALMGCVGCCIQRRRASLQYSNGCPRCCVPS